MDKRLLEEHLWWWRYDTEEKCATIFSTQPAYAGPEYLRRIFRHHWEHSAFFYEVRARYDGRYTWDFGKPWIKLSMEHRRALNCILPNPYPTRQFLPSDIGATEWVELSD